MQILFVALRHDYGIVSRGLGFEYFKFYEPLVNLGHEVTYFDLGASSTGVADSAHAAFADAVERNRPDLVCRNEVLDEFYYVLGVRSLHLRGRPH